MWLIHYSLPLVATDIIRPQTPDMKRRKIQHVHIAYCIKQRYANIGIILQHMKWIGGSTKVLW